VSSPDQLVHPWLISLPSLPCRDVHQKIRYDLCRMYHSIAIRRTVVHQLLLWAQLISCTA